MTISKQHQASNIDEVLRAFLNIVGDENLGDVTFAFDDVRLPKVLSTTWEQLEVDGLLCQTGMLYRLTPRGWRTALHLAAKLCDSEMKDKLGSLCARIKLRCEAGGVRHRGTVTIQELSEETGFSTGWISNVINSHLIETCLNQVGCDWEPDDNNENFVMIPARFGTKL